MRAVNPLWAIALLPLMAACAPLEDIDSIDRTPPVLSIPTPADPVAVENAYMQDLRNNEMLHDLYGTSGTITDYNAIPTSGTALYQGVATIRVPTSDSLSLVGDATVLANFNRDQITGQLGNFVGATNGGNYRNWDGELTMDSVVNDGINVSRDKPVQSSLFGQLTAGQNVLDVNGRAAGFFHDNQQNAQGLAMNMADGGKLTLNGRSYIVGGAETAPLDNSPAGITIIAEN